MARGISIVLRKAGMSVPTTRTQPPMAQASSQDPLVYTVRDLGRHAARIITQVEETRVPALITRDGRFVAIIEPLAPGQIESRVLAAISREVSDQG